MVINKWKRIINKKIDSCGLKIEQGLSFSESAFHSTDL